MPFVPSPVNSKNAWIATHILSTTHYIIKEQITCGRGGPTFIMVTGYVQANFGIDLETTIFLFIKSNQREKIDLQSRSRNQELKRGNH